MPATNILSTMESKGSEWTGELSAHEARQVLRGVSEVGEAVRWRPSRWAVTLLALIFGALIATAVWERFWWVFGLLALYAVLLLLLRRRLFNPHTRERPWQDLDQEDRTWKDWLMEAGWALWLPLTILLPPEPRMLGLVVGVLAGVHILWVTKDYGATP